MHKNIKRLGSQTAIYGLGGMLTQAISFFLLPLYTKYLSPSDYGSLELINNFFRIANQFFMLGLGTAMYRSFFNAETEEGRKSIVSSTAYFLLVYTFILTIPLYFMPDNISRICFGDNASPLWSRYIGLTIFLNSLFQLPLRILRAEQRAIRYLIIDVTVFLITLTLNIIFIARLNLGVLGFVEGRCIGTLMGLMIGVNIAFKYISSKPSLREISRQLKYGIPLVAANLAVFLISSSDRYFIKAIAGMDNLGIFSVSYKFASIYTFLVLTPFSIAWGPFMFSLAKQKDARNNFAVIMQAFLIIACLFFLGISAFSKEIMMFMVDKRFMPALEFIPLISAGLIVEGFAHLCSIGLHIRGKSNYLAAINWATALICLTTNYFFIRAWGMFGAAYSILLVRVILISSQFVISQKLYPIKHNYIKMLKILLLCGLVFFICSSLNLKTASLTLMGKSLAFLLFPASLFAFKLIRIEDLRKMFLKEKAEGLT